MTKQKTSRNLRSALRVAVLAVGALCVAATGARANTIVFNNAPGAGSQSNYVLGMDFDVLSAVTVTQLGAFDNNGDGFSTDVIQVGIFDMSGTLVGTSVALTGTAGTLVGGSRFLSVTTPFVLAPGRYSIVAAGFTDTTKSGNTGFGDATSFNNVGGSLQLVAGGGRWDVGTTFQLPTSGSYPQADPVFQAGTFAVPDGGMTALLLGIGITGLGLFRRMAR